jgi:hypothetical protein
MESLRIAIPNDNSAILTGYRSQLRYGGTLVISDTESYSHSLGFSNDGEQLPTHF